MLNTPEIEIGKVYEFGRFYDHKKVILGTNAPDILCRCCNKIFNWGGSTKLRLCFDCDFIFHFWYLREKGAWPGEKGPNGATYSKYTKTNIELFLAMMKGRIQR